MSIFNKGVGIIVFLFFVVFVRLLIVLSRLVHDSLLSLFPCSFFPFFVSRSSLSFQLADLLPLFTFIWNKNIFYQIFLLSITKRDDLIFFYFFFFNLFVFVLWVFWCCFLLLLLACVLMCSFKFVLLLSLF